MFTRAQLKTNAKQQLSGNWGMGVAATLIVMAISGIIGGLTSGIAAMSAVTSAVTSAVLSGGEVNQAAVSAGMLASPFYYLGCVLSLLVGAVFFYGEAKFYMGLSRTNKGEISDLFGAFKLFGKVLGAYLLMSVYVFLWSLLFVIPGIVASYRYRMVPYLLADNPEIGVSEALRRSKEMMRGHKGELFVLDLSFIGWGILVGFTFGIGILWLNPYMQMTYVNYYDALNGTGSYRGAGAQSVYSVDGKTGV